MDKEKIQQIFEDIQEKLDPVFKAIKNFVINHKIFTVIVSIAFILAASVTAFIMDKLNRINYDDGTNLSVVYTETDAIYPELSTLQSSTTLKSKFTSYKAGDGSTIFQDGSYINAVGAAILSDGTTIYPTGIVVFQDGSYIIGSGIKIAGDGIATFSDGSQLHISLFSIRKDGRILSKSPDGSISIVNNVAEHAIINSSSGTVVFNSGELTTSAKVTTTNNHLSNIGNNSQTQATPVTPTAPIVQDVDDNEIEDIIVNVDNNIKEELQQNDQAIAQNRNNNEIWYSDDIFNILLMGIDNGGKNYPYGRSDAMIVASINKKTKEVKLVSFARSAYVAIDGYANTRLNHAHGYGGAPLAISTIEKNYKIRIDRYVSTTFDAFKQLIDSLGGVDIGLTKAEIKDKTIQYALKLQGYTDLVPGVYTLNGYSALNYVRLRSIDSDKDRTQRQRNVLTSLANKAKTMSVIELNNALNNILPYVTTNLEKSEILAQMVNAPSYLNNNMEQYVLPHKSSALQLIDGFEVVLIDWETEIAYTHDVFYSGVDVKYVTG